MPSIQCIVVTPEKTALETTAEFIALPLADGEMGIGENHAPVIGRLGYGEMRIVSEGQTQRLYVDGGFVQIADNVVSILTGKAIPPSDIDIVQAETQLVEASKAIAPTDELAAIKTRNIEQACNQIRVAKRSAN
ncbi:ATP synthase F1 subunit epsilon [Blastopirellula marina]|uniref:ATP synthase epsilon chain n=1 Tax=Blastopirellula marina TaxID=124 RepID=A0A2S8FAJ7_9BACT|nr:MULTISPECIES: ATP synthase F1 subunit epsilon [Pirellulaceae]PQO29169.1 ATP synthase F1 subunit epsilon [Blastopirellula marina]RCS50362.1 ATP synthase F1 subunit epsilon [Bremerella cremea]